ncbi:Pr6Pr family membrane protein [Roseivivax sp. GX 12232]|uniref:Pr6Pr family membrane protein n=1 Tax=Roseivivax sp. GX 12232 TaxID=2900547 RepID=UPI001E3612DB|nr:Pr6Pr family membrane protein [Roseivivax sp. GX 12232]
MSPARASAALLALAALGTVLARIWLSVSEGESLGAALWSLFRYFTLWTNTAVGLYAAWVAMGGRGSARLAGGLLLSILAVGLVYHLLLAHLSDLSGLEARIDDMLHTVVPLGYLAYWTGAAPKAGLGLRDLGLWLGYPLVYCLYAILRAQLDGVYPYPFLDVSEAGPGGVALNVLGLLLAFGALALGIQALARRMARGA